MLGEKIGKLLKKVIDNRIRQHLKDRRALAPNQYGFRKKISTIDPINLLRKIVQNNDKENLDILSIDG